MSIYSNPQILAAMVMSMIESNQLAQRLEQESKEAEAAIARENEEMRNERYVQCPSVCVR